MCTTVGLEIDLAGHSQRTHASRSRRTRIAAPVLVIQLCSHPSLAKGVFVTGERDDASEFAPAVNCDIVATGIWEEAGTFSTPIVLVGQIFEAHEGPGFCYNVAQTNVGNVLQNGS